MLSTSDASPRDSKLTLPNTSVPLLSKESVYGEVANANAKKRSLLKWVIAAAVLLVVVVLAVVLPVYFTVIKPNNHHSAASAPSDDQHTSAAPSPSTTPRIAITGGDGSTVTTEDGSTFTYRNKFSGFCESFVVASHDP
jgi:glucan 1,3-beta-glucosidase